MADGDTEVVFSTGRLLGVFFALVLICALFFAIGYSFGRKSAINPSESLIPDPNALPGATTVAGGPKPAAGAVNNGNCPDVSAAPPVEGVTPATTLDPNQPAPETPQPAPAVVENKPAETPAPAAKPPAPPPQPEMNRPAPPPPASGYMVQVAAVSKPEDAQALVNALRKKQYQVFVANATANDKLYHVQVGPFSDLKSAEAMRAKLVADGYNAIVKR